MNDLTRVFNAMDQSDPRAAEEILPIVYEELRRLAARKMSLEQPGHTLQATALVHEAWLRLVGEEHRWHNQRHFFSAAAEAMRRILIEGARRKRRIRHGGGQPAVPIDGIDIAIETDPDLLLQIHEALDRLAEEDPVKAELVKLRFFAGMRIPDAANALGLSATTAKRYWTYARAWLFAELNRSA